MVGPSVNRATPTRAPCGRRPARHDVGSATEILDAHMLKKFRKPRDYPVTARNEIQYVAYLPAPHCSTPVVVAPYYAAGEHHAIKPAGAIQLECFGKQVRAIAVTNIVKKWLADSAGHQRIDL